MSWLGGGSCGLCCGLRHTRQYPTLMITIGALKKRLINPQLLSCHSLVPTESLGWDHITPLCAKRHQNTAALSIHRGGVRWVGNPRSRLQFNTAVSWWWRATISDTFSVCFPVDKRPWGKSRFQLHCLRRLCQHTPAKRS